MSVRFRLSARRLAKLSGNCATGGANHIRSSLLVIAVDTAAVSTAEVGAQVDHLEDETRRVLASRL